LLYETAPETVRLILLLSTSKNNDSRSTYSHSDYDLSVLSPFVLTTDLLLLLGGEVVGNVESLADLLRRLALDHVGHSLAADIEKRLDIKEIGCLGFWLAANSNDGDIRSGGIVIYTYKNNLKEHFLIHLHELLVPLLDISRLLAGIRLVIRGRDGIVTVVLAPLHHLSQDCFIDLSRPC
jgi:hypothetical protein